MDRQISPEQLHTRAQTETRMSIIQSFPTACPWIRCYGKMLFLGKNIYLCTSSSSHCQLKGCSSLYFLPGRSSIKFTGWSGFDSSGTKENDRFQQSRMDCWWRIHVFCHLTRNVCCRAIVFWICMRNGISGDADVQRRSVHNSRTRRHGHIKSVSQGVVYHTHKSGFRLIKCPT